MTISNSGASDPSDYSLLNEAVRVRDEQLRLAEAAGIGEILTAKTWSPSGISMGIYSPGTASLMTSLIARTDARCAARRRAAESLTGCFQTKGVDKMTGYEKSDFAACDLADEAANMLVMERAQTATKFASQDRQRRAVARESITRQLEIILRVLRELDAQEKADG